MRSKEEILLDIMVDEETCLNCGMPKSFEDLICELQVFTFKPFFLTIN